MKWNNTDLLTYGIVVDSYPSLPRGERNVTTYTSVGRNGYISIDEGTYQSIIINVNCHYDPIRTTKTYDEARAFINGFGTLEIESGKYYDAYVYGTIDYAKMGLTSAKSFTIQFACQPIAHKSTSTTLTYTTFPQTFTIGGTAPTRPIITIQGTGDNQIMVNNKLFVLYGMVSGETYTLDCEAMTIKDHDGDNCSSMMRFDFPELVAGNNSLNVATSMIAITDDDNNVMTTVSDGVMAITNANGITSMTITYKEAYL